MTRSTIALSKLGPGVDNLGLRRVDVPEPRAGEVVLEVISAGICGTDLHIAADEFPSHPPVTMGHEVTGEVVAMGVGVDGDLVGGRFATETYFYYCDTCEYCTAGRPNLCAQRRSIGSHVDGGFARWMVVPARNLHRLPDSVARHAGSLAEPLACVAQCLLGPNQVQPGDRVLVTGPGTMGVLTAQVAVACGGDVTLVGLARDRIRLDVAASLGITTAVVGSDDAPTGEFDVVCEASGAEAAAALALEFVRKGGTYVQVGIFGAPITFDVDALLYKEVSFATGFASTPASWRSAMQLIESGAVQLDPLISDVVPLNHWEAAFEATRNGTGLKFVLDPRQDGDEDGET